ncbi:MAG: competence protein ComEC [Parcubacteria bacterium C7867-003]|nr:MAG: competence protein ComEC [Parcubacteria bacterium C7867-003]
MKEGYLHIKTYLRWYFLLVLFVLAIVLFWILLNPKKEGILTFAVLDVGQGDSLYIESPTGIQVIVDGGPGNNLLKVLPKVMPFYDRSVDMIVVTNPDSDHYEGFIKFLDKYSVSNILEPGTTNAYPAYEVFQKKIEQKNITKTLTRRGQVVDLGGGAYLQVLFPDRNVSEVAPNTGSIVMKLVYGETSVLLQGDSISNIEQYLLELDGDYLKSDILKAGHHGSKTSSVEEYVEKVAPKWTVISSGENNSYGHPHKETLQTMNKLKIPTFDTCNNGTIVFESDGKTFVLKNKNIKEAVVGCKTK